MFQTASGLSDDKYKYPAWADAQTGYLNGLLKQKTAWKIRVYFGLDGQMPDTSIRPTACGENAWLGEIQTSGRLKGWTAPQKLDTPSNP